MSELLPCPFCGGEPDEYEGEYGNGIYCMQCGAMVGEPIHLGFDVAERVSYEQAIEAWNTRAAYEMDGWFYLPKPKQQLFNYTTGFSFDDLSLKATGTVDVYAMTKAVQKWQEEVLNAQIIERICEVFKPERTCQLIEDVDLLHCSECGGAAEERLWAYWHYCPNCGARVVSE